MCKGPITAQWGANVTMGKAVRIASALSYASLIACTLNYARGY